MGREDNTFAAIGILLIAVLIISALVWLAMIALGDDGGRGSARSIPGFHLYDALAECSEHLGRFGGHRQAAGCTLPGDRIPELRKRLNEHARSVLSSEDFIPVLSLDQDFGHDG